MAQKVLVLGESGTGKSASLRNFSPDEITVISCAGKPLPFKGEFELVKPRFDKLTQDVVAAMVEFERSGKHVLAIDDAQYIMSFQYMRRIKENGWDKWNDIQGDFFNILQMIDEMDDERTVYVLSHIARDENGREKIKTMGKMLDEKITIEGLFTTVLKTGVADGQYFLFTQNSGNDTVKSPIGMFDTYAIDNDLKYVDVKLRNYYRIGSGFATDDEVAELDEKAAKPEVEKPDTDGRKRRRRKEHAKAEDGTNEKEKPEEAPVEEEAQEAASANAAEQPTKRRRKRRAAVEITDDESDIPF